MRTRNHSAISRRASHRPGIVGNHKVNPRSSNVAAKAGSTATPAALAGVYALGAPVPITVRPGTTATLGPVPLGLGTIEAGWLRITGTAQGPPPRQRFAGKGDSLDQTSEEEPIQPGSAREIGKLFQLCKVNGSQRTTDSRNRTPTAHGANRRQEDCRGRKRASSPDRSPHPEPGGTRRHI